MDTSALKTLNAERRARRAAILVTDLGDGSDRIVREGDAVAGELGEALAKAFRTGNSGSVEADGAKLFPQRASAAAAPGGDRRGAYQPGAGADGADRRLSAGDHRSAHGLRHAGPVSRMSTSMPNGRRTCSTRQPLDSYTALAAVTHDPKIDDFALKAALDAGCFYVGALGSRKTHAKRVERLLALGATPDDDRAHPCADRPRHRRGEPGRDRRRGAGAGDRAPSARAACRRAQAEGRSGMKFGPVPVEDAEGAMLAHATTAGDKRFRKAHRADGRGYRRPEGGRRRARSSRPFCPPTISTRTRPRRGSPAACAFAASRRSRPRPAASICMRRRPASSPSTRR